MTNKHLFFLNQIGWINFVILTLTVERIRAVFVAKNEKFCTICTWLYLTDLLGTKEHTSTKVHVQVHPWYTYEKNHRNQQTF